MPTLHTSAVRPRRRCVYCPSFHTSRPFTTFPRRSEEDVPNHYETLGLLPTASPTEIKTSFYALSKRHHPDRNPGDAHAARKFVRISDAYHVLSSPDARRSYDSKYHAHHHGRHSGSSGGGGGGGGEGIFARGSHSSHSSPAGGRPASGLSRRRAQFRGPPPSFYAGGGWGAYAAKRASAQYGSSSNGGAGTYEDEEELAASKRHGGAARSNRRNASDSGGGDGGFSPGQHGPAYDPDSTIPHWDRAGHFRTQENIRRRSEMAARARGRVGRRSVLEDQASEGSGMLVQFSAVLGCLVGVVATSGWFISLREKERKIKAVSARENG